jgi:hypothetical protein
MINTTLLTLPILVLLATSNWSGSHSNAESSTISYSSSRIKVGGSPGSVETADFNNDGFPDLVVASETDSSVTVLLGDGRGGFAGAKGSPFFAGPIPNDLAIGDFNKDGNLDLAVANHERQHISVLLGDGKGGFAHAPRSPFPTEGIPHVHGVAIGDFNSDGWLDIATDSWGNDNVEVLFGDRQVLLKTPGPFFKVGKRPYQRLRSADLNGDGIPDIVTTNTEGNNATVLLADGKGGFREPPGSPFPCGDNPFGLAIGDLNADGRPDLAIINSPGSMAQGRGRNGLTVLLGDGTGRFTTMKGSPFGAGRIPSRIAIGDVNGDGVNDIVTSDNDDNKVYLFLMGRNGAVLSTTPITVGNHPKGVAIADVNGDGKGDIVVCNNADNDISIILSK